jgi:Zinc-ribbon containing domain
MKQKRDQKKEKKKSSRSYQDDFLILLEAGLRKAGSVTRREFDRISEDVQRRLERRYGKERLEDFSSRVKANWQDVIRKLNQAGSKIEMTDSFRKTRQAGARVLENLAEGLKRAAENLEANLSDKITYHAGQVVDKGVYFCVVCRKIQELKRRRKLPNCPECGNYEFRQA